MLANMELMTIVYNSLVVQLYVADLEELIIVGLAVVPIVLGSLIFMSTGPVPEHFSNIN